MRNARGWLMRNPGYVSETPYWNINNNTTGSLITCQSYLVMSLCVSQKKSYTFQYAIFWSIQEIQQHKIYYWIYYWHLRYPLESVEKGRGFSRLRVSVADTSITVTKGDIKPHSSIHPIIYWVLLWIDKHNYQLNSVPFLGARCNLSIIIYVTILWGLNIIHACILFLAMSFGNIIVDLDTWGAYSTVITVFSTMVYRWLYIYSPICCIEFEQ